MIDKEIIEIDKAFTKLGIKKTVFADRIGMVPSTFFNKLNAKQSSYSLTDEEKIQVYDGIIYITEELIRLLPEWKKPTNLIR